MWPDLWFGALATFAGWGGVIAWGRVQRPRDWSNRVASGCVLGEGTEDSAGEPDRRPRVQRPRNSANHVASGCIRVHLRGGRNLGFRAHGGTQQDGGGGEHLVGLDPAVDGDATDAVRFGGARKG